MWQPDEEAALKIRLCGGEPPFQSDEVVLLESQLQGVDEVVATLNEANTQKSKRKKRTTQDESSLKNSTKNLKTVEDDPPASPEAAVASTPTLSEVPTLSKPSSRCFRMHLECLYSSSTSSFLGGFKLHIFSSSLLSAESSRRRQVRCGHGGPYHCRPLGEPASTQFLLSFL